MPTPLTGVPWVAVAVSDLQNARPGVLVTAFDSTALGPGQSSRTSVAIQKCTAELLGAVGYSGRVIMDASQGTVTPDVVPPNLFDYLVEKICRQLERALNKPWTDEEKQDERTYQNMLNSLRKGEFPVDATNNPGNLAAISSQGGAVTSFGGARRYFAPGCRGFLGSGL